MKVIISIVNLIGLIIMIYNSLDYLNDVDKRLSYIFVGAWLYYSSKRVLNIK